MAKFEIEAKIGANSAEFQRKLKEASKESREFAKSVHENVGQVKEVFGEIAGEAGIGKLTKAFGSASLAAAAFGAALVAAIKDGTKEWAEFQDTALKFGQITGTYKADVPLKEQTGGQIADFVEEHSGHRGDQKEGNQALMNLIETYGKSPEAIEKAKKAFLEFQNEAKETGKSIVELTEANRRFHAAGPDATAGGAKLLKSDPMMAGMIEEEKKAMVAALESKLAGGAMKAQLDKNAGRPIDPQYLADLKAIQDIKGDPSEANKKALALDPTNEDKRKAVYGENNADFMKHLTPDQYDAMRTKRYGPGGESANAADQGKDMLSGQFADVGLKISQFTQAIGEGLTPALSHVLAELIDELPRLTSTAVQLGEALGRIITWMDDIKGDSPYAAGEKAGTAGQQTVLREKFGLYGVHADGSPITAMDYQMNQKANSADREHKALSGHGTIEYLKSIAGDTQATKEFLASIKENTGKDPADVQ